MLLNYGKNNLPQGPTHARKPWRPLEPQWLLPIKGNYELGNGEISDLYPYAIHYVRFGPKSGTYITHREVDCVPCHCSNLGHGNISLSHKFLFSSFLIGWFHLVEETSQQGRKYKVKRLCGKPHNAYCKYCAEGSERTFGRIVPWQLGNPDTEELNVRIIELAKTCRTCGKYLVPQVLQCSNCGFLLKDMTRYEIAPEVFGEYLEEIKHPISCPSCNNFAPPFELSKCGGGCSLPTRTSVFDCAFKVTTTEKVMNNKEGQTFKILHILQTKIFNLEEMKLEYEVTDEHIKPEFFQPIDPSPYVKEETTAQQAAKMKVDNPFKHKNVPTSIVAPNQSQQSLFRNYQK